MNHGRLLKACLTLWLLPSLVESRISAYLPVLRPPSQVSAGASGGTRRLAQLQAAVPAPYASPPPQTISSRIYTPELDDPLQRQALMDLYMSTSGPTWTWQSVLPPTLQNGSPVAAPSPAAGIETESATFLTEQLLKFPWGTPNISYCLWQVYLVQHLCITCWQPCMLPAQVWLVGCL